jgi:Ca2+-binding RTX toxin-like protein
LASSSGVTLNLQSGGIEGDAEGDTYTSIERVFGSQFQDDIIGSDGDDILFGNREDDFLYGGKGNDTLIGGQGNDIFGYSTIDGGADVINDFSDPGFIFIFGGDPNFDTFAELSAVSTDVGNNVIFNFGGGNTLTILGYNSADFNTFDFDFTLVTPNNAAGPLNNPDTFAAEPSDILDMDALI